MQLFVKAQCEPVQQVMAECLSADQITKGKNTIHLTVIRDYQISHKMIYNGSMSTRISEDLNNDYSNYST